MPRTTSTKRSSPVPVVHKPTPIYPARPPFTPVAPSSFGQTLKEGLAFGTGQAIAHRAVASVASLWTPPQKTSESPCEKERYAFESCMKIKSTDDFCGNEQLSYAQCIQLTKLPPSGEAHKTTQSRW